MNDKLLLKEIRDIARSMITCSHYNNLDDKTFDNYLLGILAKVKIHYEQELRIKNPFEEKIPVSSVDGEGAYFRGCYDGFERLRRELK